MSADVASGCNTKAGCARRLIASLLSPCADVETDRKAPPRIVRSQSDRSTPRRHRILVGHPTCCSLLLRLTPLHPETLAFSHLRCPCLLHCSVIVCIITPHPYRTTRNLLQVEAPQICIVCPDRFHLYTPLPPPRLPIHQLGPPPLPHALQ